MHTNRTITLDDVTADRLRDYGGGNLSEGVRRAAALIPYNDNALDHLADLMRLIQRAVEELPEAAKTAASEVYNETVRDDNDANELLE